VKAVVDEKAAERKAAKTQTAAAKARSARKPLRLRLVAGLLAVVLAVALVASIPLWRHPFAEPSGAQADRNARQALVFAAGLVDRWTATHGKPPEQLTDVGVKIPGMTLVRTDDGWSLTLPSNGRPITFHRGDDPTAFLNIP
jgi:hypothetical protein